MGTSRSTTGRQFIQFLGLSLAFSLALEGSGAFGPTNPFLPTIQEFSSALKIVSTVAPSALEQTASVSPKSQPGCQTGRVSGQSRPRIKARPTVPREVEDLAEMQALRPEKFSVPKAAELPRLSEPVPLGKLCAFHLCDQPMPRVLEFPLLPENRSFHRKGHVKVQCLFIIKHEPAKPVQTVAWNSEEEESPSAEPTEAEVVEAQPVEVEPVTEAVPAFVEDATDALESPKPLVDYEEFSDAFDDEENW